MSEVQEVVTDVGRWKKKKSRKQQFFLSRVRQTFDVSLMAGETHAASTVVLRDNKSKPYTRKDKETEQKVV